MGLSWGNFASQKRSTCFLTPSSTATSPILRNASAAFDKANPPPKKIFRLLGRVAPDQAGVDALLHDVAGPEHQHAPRRDGHFLARLRVTPDALSLLANAEGTEGGE